MKMENSQRWTLARISELVHHKFLWFLTGAYVAAAVVPAAGLWMRNLSLGTVNLVGQHAQVSFPSLMLSALLFNAGLGMQFDRMRTLARNPLVLLAGLVGNLAVPLLFILGMSQTLLLWHNPTEVQCVLVGLALVASMPVAGSSTAWTQNANGDLALSLGLVVLSTFLSPMTTPAVLHAVGWVASGTYADALHELAIGGTSLFLMLFVLLPSLLGIAARCMIGEHVLSRCKPALKLTNSLNLLVLCYSNAAVALPQMISNPDWDFLAMILALVLALCVVGFVAGWLIARLLGTDEASQTSLIFGLGMSNNGTGQLLAATALAHLPSVMLPVIFYNLAQHVVAAAANRLNSRRERAVPASETCLLPLSAEVARP